MHLYTQSLHVTFCTHVYQLRLGFEPMSCTKSHVLFAACIHLWARRLDAWLSKVCTASAQVQTAYAAYLCSDGVMDGQTDGWTDRLMDRQTDGQTD